MVEAIFDKSKNKMFDNSLTHGVKLKGAKQNLSPLVMKEEFITIRELLRNYKKLANSKKTYIVTKNGKPEKVIIPFKEWNNQKSNKPKSISLAEAIEKYSFTGSGEANLSDPNEIDKILYGAPNPNRNKNDNS